MIDPTEAAVAALPQDSDGSDALAGKKPSKNNAAETIRIELEELLITHGRKVKEFIGMADPERCKRITERTAYHLDRLASAHTKALSKLGDVPQAEKWEARHTDCKCIKECLMLFKQLRAFRQARS